MLERDNSADISIESNELEHKTKYPGIDDEWSLYHVNYAPGENKELNNVR